MISGVIEVRRKEIKRKRLTGNNTQISDVISFFERLMSKTLKHFAIVFDMMTKIIS